MAARTLNLTHERGVEQYADYRYRLPPVEYDLTGCEGRAQIRSFAGVVVGEFQVVFVRREYPGQVELQLSASTIAPGIYLWDLLIHSPANESVRLYEGWVDIDAGATNWNVYPPQQTTGDRLTEVVNQQNAVIAQQNSVIANLQQAISNLSQEIESVRLDPTLGIVTPQLQAAITMSALRIVAIRPDGMIEYADSDDSVHAFDVVGILTESVNTGEFTRPLVQGVVQTPGWNWVKGDPIFLGNNGFLTQTPPFSGFMLVVGTPITSTLIKFELQEPTIL